MQAPSFCFLYVKNKCKNKNVNYINCNERSGTSSTMVPCVAFIMYPKHHATLVHLTTCSTPSCFWMGIYRDWNAMAQEAGKTGCVYVHMQCLLHWLLPQWFCIQTGRKITPFPAASFTVVCQVARHTSSWGYDTYVEAFTVVCQVARHTMSSWGYDTYVEAFTVVCQVARRTTSFWG